MVPGAFSTFDLSLDCCSIVVFISTDGHCKLRHWLRQSWGAGGLHHGCDHIQQHPKQMLSKVALIDAGSFQVSAFQPWLEETIIRNRRRRSQ